MDKLSSQHDELAVMISEEQGIPLSFIHSVVAYHYGKKLPSTA
ncbi:hypothetical protein [Thalassotalea atypica]|nr:hypothetical protein [Thalassotalea atypica]